MRSILFSILLPMGFSLAAFGQCSPTLNPTTANIGTQGGSGQFSVSAGCAWTASTNYNWIHVAFGQSGGTNGGTVGYTVDAGTSRTGTILVNSTTFTVSQGGSTGPCQETVQPSSQTVPSAGGQFNIGISTQCPWNASTNSSWITLSATSGTIGTLYYTVAPNPSAAVRNGAIYVDGHTVTIMQFGTACVYVVSPPALTLSATGGTGQISIQTPDLCSWTVYNPSTWITLGVKNGIYSYGAGTLAYTVAASSDLHPRSSTLVIANEELVITQAGTGHTTVVNGASFLSGAIAPGELIAIFGAGLGPSQPSGLQLTPDGLSVTTSLAGTRVLFDGIAAPIIYASDSQVNAIAPFALAGAVSTQIVVEVQGVASTPVTEPVATSSPALFATPDGQAAALNQDNSANGASNPAAVGSVLQFFGTGFGQMAPSGVDGQLTHAASVVLGKVTATIGGIDAPVRYAGSAGGLVAGVVQLNIGIPAGVTPGNSVPVVLSIAGASSPSGVTVAVK